MIRKLKKRAMKTAMKLMMNEKVAKTVMTAFQKKNDLNEKLARLYAEIQLPSLADHQTVGHALDRMRRRVKDLEKELSQAEFALDKVESAMERLEQANSGADEPLIPREPAVRKPKIEGLVKDVLVKKKPAPAPAPKKEKTAPAKKTTKPVKKAKAKKAAGKTAETAPKAAKPAAPKKSPTKAKPKRAPRAGLLDLDFKKR